MRATHPQLKLKGQGKAAAGMELWSTVFLPDPYGADCATCTVPLNAWRRITEENPGSRLFGRIRYEGKEIYAALGGPNQDIEGSSEKLYLPSWMLDNLGAPGEGEQVDVEWLSQEAFPEATRIVLRPHDSAFYHGDAKEELERCLTRLGVLRQGDTLVLQLECLGGFDIVFDVIITEPANLVLAEGDEVAIEFEEALDSIAPPEPRPDTPIPENPFVPTQVQEPECAAKRLGGEERFMPDGTRWNPWKHGPWSKDSELKKE